MGWRLDKSRDEFHDWWGELYTENHVLRRRYGKPREWPHLVVDIPNATFEHLHYTLAHALWVWLGVEAVLWVYNLVGGE